MNSILQLPQRDFIDSGPGTVDCGGSILLNDVLCENRIHSITRSSIDTAFVPKGERTSPWKGTLTRMASTR